MLKLSFFRCFITQHFKTSKNIKTMLSLIGMRQGTFHPLVLFGSGFVSWIIIKSFQTFLEVKIDINWINLTPCQAQIESYKKYS